MSDDTELPKGEPSLDDLMGDAPAEKPSGRRKKAEETIVEAADAERLHPILSNEEVLAARAKAKTRVEAERRAAAMRAIEDEETERLRLEDGLTTGIGVLDEIVAITMDLPPFAGAKISINGPLGSHYYHGVTYNVPRHVAETLAEAQFRMWRHEDQTEGRDLRQQYARKYGTTLNAKTGAVTSSVDLRTSMNRGEHVGH